MCQRIEGELPLIGAHRGVCGGNIPGNTLEAFEAALAQGAGVIELDVSQSADGELFVFHPGMEPVYLGCDRLLSQMSTAEIERLRFKNADGNVTQYGISRLEEALRLLKGRCLVNIDKFWDNIIPVTAMVRRLGMQDQVLVKTGPVKEQIDCIEKEAPDLPYLLILHDSDEITEEMLRRPLRYAGVEAVFASEQAPIASKAYVESMHEKNLIVWANAIVYNYRDVLAAGHNDDISVSGRPDEGWGWLLVQGYDIIQTDWPLMLSQYMYKNEHHGQGVSKIEH